MTSGIVTGIKQRRKHERYAPPAQWEARVEFEFPKPGGQPCSMRLKDISAGGLCFVLERDLPGLDVGESLDQATVVVGDRRIAGDLFVMRLTPNATKGATCGAFFFPAGDENILAIQAVVAAAASKWPQNLSDRRRRPR